MSWYSDRLAAMTGQPAAPAAPYRPQTGPGIPAHLAPYAQGQQQAQAAPQGQHPPAGTVASAAENLKGLQQQFTSCPNCGGENVYVLNQGKVFTSSGQSISPMQCDDCGWPRTQQFSKLGAGNLAKPSGPPQQARQLPTGHVPDAVVREFGSPTTPGA